MQCTPNFDSSVWEVYTAPTLHVFSVSAVYTACTPFRSENAGCRYTEYVQPRCSVHCQYTQYVQSRYTAVHCTWTALIQCIGSVHCAYTAVPHSTYSLPQIHLKKCRVLKIQGTQINSSRCTILHMELTNSLDQLHRKCGRPPRINLTHLVTSRAAVGGNRIGPMCVCVCVSVI